MSSYDVGIFRHRCTEPGCKHMVQFDDEPKCFKHSPDSGSSVSGYSAKAAAIEQIEQLRAQGYSIASIAEALDIHPSTITELTGDWVFATSCNTGPTWTGADPIHLKYLGKDINEAEAAVGNFIRYQRDEKDFPKSNLELYTAVPVKDAEMIQWFMADGWWFSIYRFKL